ncbi:MAG TPA: DUF929 family protein [Acidimicrobiales bacterium]|nr:DUF929 family protein [Acidimicrobiales bacterium]
MVVVVLVAVAVTSGSSKATATTPAPADVVQATTNVPADKLAAAGVGPSNIQPPKVTTGNQAALTSNGLPQVLYMGAEYCPYCAAERWPMVVALSRFGTFSHLGATESSTVSGEVFPGTKTFSFNGSSYTSPYLVFTPVEMQSNQPSGNGYATLQTPTKAQQALLQKYDQPPYTQSSGGIPFVDFGNRYIVSGASYSPQVLQGQSMAAIAGSLVDPSNQIAQNVDGTANILTAAICQLTNNQPGQVCNTPAITAAKGKLNG